MAFRNTLELSTSADADVIAQDVADDAVLQPPLMSAFNETAEPIDGIPLTDEEFSACLEQALQAALNDSSSEAEIPSSPYLPLPELFDEDARSIESREISKILPELLFADLDVVLDTLLASSTVGLPPVPEETGKKRRHEESDTDSEARSACIDAKRQVIAPEEEPQPSGPVSRRGKPLYKGNRSTQFQPPQEASARQNLDEEEAGIVSRLRSQKGTAGS